MLCPSIPYYLAPLMPSILCILFVNDAKPMVLPQSERSSFTPIWNNSQMCVCMCVCVFLDSKLRNTACLLGMRVRIPAGAWMSVCFDCCVLSGRGLCVGLITLSEESYLSWCVQWVWPWSPVRGGHNSVSSRSATVEKYRKTTTEDSGPSVSISPFQVSCSTT
jgi:hypothetical protein